MGKYWWVVPIAIVWLIYHSIRKYFLMSLLILAAIGGFWYWNSQAETQPPVIAPITKSTTEPTPLESVSQWLVDNTPKK